MKTRTLVVAVAICICASVLFGQGRQTIPAPPSIEHLLNLSGRFVQRLEDDLTFVIGDEAYRQAIVNGPRGSTLDSTQIESEMFFMWLSDEQIWLSVRNVTMVDHRRVRDSQQRLNRALAESSSGLVSRLRQLQDDNSRFNIGSLYSTLGYPTVALQFLLPTHQQRFAFTLGEADRIGGATVRKLSFVERQSPSEVSFNGQDMPSSGTVWLREADGAVVRTQLHLATPSRIDISMTVDFRRDRKLNVWVPARMEERYQERGGELTTRLATYTNFHRFETSARVVLPSP